MAPYLAEASGDLARAADVYLWATELAGALHAQISFVELAVRNALDAQIQTWNVSHGGPSEWTAAGAAQADLYSILKGSLNQARDRAKSDAAMRGPHHPRHGAQVTHDDMVAQLTFGTWVKLLRPLSASESSARQEHLWREQLHYAFPRTGSDDAARAALGSQLDSIRYLRNRVAHHDNLLTVNVQHRLRDMLSVLAKIDQDYATLAMARSNVRRLVREDPRRTW